MHSLGTFTIPLDRGLKARLFGPNRVLKVEVLTDDGSTRVLVDCSACRELLQGRLPRGELIPVVGAIRDFFSSRGMRRLEVRVSRYQMSRTYEGLLRPSDVRALYSAVADSVSGRQVDRGRARV